MEKPLTGAHNNLKPFVAKVAIGCREKLSVFGNDYSTSNGTDVRDYIHVLGLVRGHIAALRHMFARDGSFVSVILNRPEGGDQTVQG